MMYPYITLPDETEIVHSQIVTESGKQKVIVNFERPTETGFDSARCEIPGNTWISVVGYSSEEIRRFIRKQMFKNIGLYHQWNGLLRFIIW